MTRLSMPDGREFNYLDVGRGPALILLHGWGMSSGIFTEVISGLTDDFRLLVPDFRGHGKSSTGVTYSLDDFAADLTAWFNSLKLDRCNLMGWSMGGQVALHLAAEKALPIERLILVSSTPKFCQSDDWQYGLPDIQVRAMQRQFRRDPGSTLNDFIAMMFAGEQNMSQLTTKTQLKNISPDPDAGARSLATLQSIDIRDRLPSITVPTLIHHGEADTIIPVAAGNYLAEHIDSADRVIWDGIGHAPFLSRRQGCQDLWKEFVL